jgi:hypothetical protein
MKDWVRPFLLEQHRKEIEELDKRALDRHVKNFEKMIKNEEVVWDGLTETLNAHFGCGGIGGDSQWMIGAFGSTLADLPKEVFLRFEEMKHVFYVFTPSPGGAEVKPFILDQDHDVDKWDRVIIVSFPYEISCKPSAAARGMIVHELAHVYLHSDEMAITDEMENEADQTAIEWGFGDEIKALRDYEKEYLQDQEPDE